MFDGLISHAKGYKYMPLSSLEAEACLDPAEELEIVKAPPEAEEKVKAPAHNQPIAHSGCEQQASLEAATEDSHS